MTVLAVAVAAVCAVLVTAGIAKVAQPEGTTVVLHELGVPGGAGAARALGIVEIALGVAGLSIGGRWLPAAVAAAYLAAAGVVVAARRVGLGSCGCFGARSPAPSGGHAILDLGCAAVAGLGAVADVPALATVVEDRAVPGAAAVLVATVLLAVGLVTLFLRPGA